MSNPEVEEIGPDDDEGVEAFRPKPKSETSRRLMAMKSGTVLRPIVPDGPEQLFAMAKMIHVSRLAPKELSPEQIAVCIMFGAEIGLMPMQSLQGIAVINGRPSVWGAVAMALVRRSGLLESHREWLDDPTEIEIEAPDANGEMRTIKVPERIAHCTVKRVHEEERDFTFSITDARMAGLWNNPKKPIWQQYPERMLKMRARGFAFRDTFADALAGLYLREEANDFDAIDITPPPPAPPQTSGLAQRLKEGAKPGTGFQEQHVETEMETLDKFSKEEAKIIAELTTLLNAAKTPEEILAISLQGPENVSIELRDALVEMIERRKAELALVA